MEVIGVLLAFLEVSLLVFWCAKAARRHARDTGPGRWAASRRPPTGEHDAGVPVDHEEFWRIVRHLLEDTERGAQ